MPRIDSPVRRVLGDKTTNASIKSQKNRMTWKNPASSCDSLSVSFGDTLQSPKTSSVSRSPRVGRKRKIEEVEEAERNESQHSTGTQTLSQVTDLLSDGSLNMVDSATNTRSTAQTSLTSFYASQAEVELAEAQFEFEIHEEMSQRTLDKMVCGLPRLIEMFADTNDGASTRSRSHKIPRSQPLFCVPTCSRKPHSSVSVCPASSTSMATNPRNTLTDCKCLSSQKRRLCQSW